jgi:hypothetical protein
MNCKIWAYPYGLSSHLNEIRDVQPRTRGCEECLKTGDRSGASRLCLSCAHVGCCDSSPNRHATKHFHSNVVTPIWPESVLRMYVRPKLRRFELGWINFAVLRRSHSTLHKQRNSDLKIIADQQAHGMRTHLDNYVQSGVAEWKAVASKLYADFYWSASQTRLIEVDAFRRDLQSC